MITVPISDVVPLAQWIQAYHSFRVRLDLLLYQMGGPNLVTLHQTRLGSEASPGVWETQEYRVTVRERTITFEVWESSTTDAALAAFDAYQTNLFRD